MSVLLYRRECRISTYRINQILGRDRNDDFILYLLCNWCCGYDETGDESDSVDG